MVPILLAALDGTVTLMGQPPAYWEGDYSQAFEGTPGFRILLTHSPAAFIIGLAVWVLAFVGMILMLPSTLALAVCLQFTLGHTIGAFSWLNRFPHGRELPIAINAIAALSLALGIRWVWACKPQDDVPIGATLPIALRWAILAALCAPPIWFTWPRWF
jgi:hypothetical protein